MENNVYYILKIKGKAKIPDYIQIRDANFTLIGYFRPDRFEKIKKSFGDPAIGEKMIELIAALPFGKIRKVEV